MMQPKLSCRFPRAFRVSLNKSFVEPKMRLNRLSYIALVAISLFLTDPAFATTVIGVGTASCGTWIEARRNRTSFAYEQWAIGFASGVSVALDLDLLKGRDASAIWVWMDGYCASHPLELMGAAIAELINSLNPGTFTRTH